MKLDNIYNVLNSYLKRSNRNDTNEVICRFMLNHLLEIPEMSVNEIAEACYTSHPSIIRFTKEIGFDGISDFKYNVQNYLDEIRNRELRVHFPVKTTSDNQEFKQSLEEWLTKQNDLIISSLIKTDRNKIRKLCQEINSHKKILLMGSGLSETILELFRIELARCGKIINNIGTDMDALGGYEKEDTLLLILSMNGLFFRDLKRNSETEFKKYIRKNIDRSWLMTLDKDLSQAPCDELIHIDNENLSFEYTLNLTIALFELIGQCYQETFC